MSKLVRIDLSKPSENPKNIWDRDQSDPTMKFRTSGGLTKVTIEFYIKAKHVDANPNAVMTDAEIAKAMENNRDIEIGLENGYAKGMFVRIEKGTTTKASKLMISADISTKPPYGPLS